MGDREEDKPESEKGEQTKHIGTPIIAYKLKPAGWFGADAVPGKSGNHYAAKRLSQDLKWFGYPRVIWTSHQEPSIVALRDLVQQYLGVAVDISSQPHSVMGERVGVGIQESPVGESQSNGVAENTMKQVQGHVRVIRDGLEARYKQKVGAEHPSLPWLVRHAAGVKSRLQVGEDGKTGYERLRGKRFKGEWVEFDSAYGI